MKTILLGVSGSISAYKAADITSQLAKLGYNVEILMTKSSTAFITPLTLQSLSKNPVHTDVMMEIDPSKIKPMGLPTTYYQQLLWHFILKHQKLLRPR